MDEYFGEILRQEEEIHKVAAPFRFVKLKQAQEAPAAPVQAAAPTQAAPPTQQNAPTAQPQQDPAQMMQQTIQDFEASPVVKLFMQPAPPSTPGPEAQQPAPGAPGQAVGPQPVPQQGAQAAGPAPGAPMAKMGAEKLAVLSASMNLASGLATSKEQRAKNRADTLEGIRKRREDRKAKKLLRKKAAAAKPPKKLTVKAPKAPKTSFKPIPAVSVANPSVGKEPAVGRSSTQAVASAKPKTQWKPPTTNSPVVRAAKVKLPKSKVTASAGKLAPVDLKKLRERS